MNEEADDPGLAAEGVKAAVESVLDSRGIVVPVTAASLEAGKLVVDLPPQAGTRPGVARLESTLREALPHVDAVRVNRSTPGTGIWLLVDVFRLAG